VCGCCDQRVHTERLPRDPRTSLGLGHPRQRIYGDGDKHQCGKTTIPVTCNAAERMTCHPDSVALRCLIVDDNDAFLEAAAKLLERQGLAVVGVASNSTQAIERARKLRPDVVLIDIALGRESGLDLARRFGDETQLKPCPPLILISTHSEAEYADLIKETPAAGFVPKSELSAAAVLSVAG
jgi:CheY-like chemotaxis protein